MPPSWAYLYLFFLYSSSLLITSAALVNVTVDDQGTDPRTGSAIVYTPEGTLSVGQQCAGCSTQPDLSQAYQGTWHDATSIETATFTFTGMSPARLEVMERELMAGVVRGQALRSMCMGSLCTVAGMRQTARS